MEVKPKKTIRFDALVKTAGQPIQVTLWTKPEDDLDFMRAVKEKRVVTVIQHNIGTKKDYGLVGFYPQDRATYFIFPKAIDDPDETKIVGIKYDKLATPEPKGAIYKPPAPKPPGIPLREKPVSRDLPRADREADHKPKRKSKSQHEPRPKPEPPAQKPKPAPPKLFNFQSKIQIKATQTTTIDVEATSATEAAELIKQRAENLTIDPDRAQISRSISKPRKTKSH